MSVRTLLLDADGCLFPSEEPAFVASTRVINALMEELGSDARYEPEELRRVAMGKTFRATATDLASASGSELSKDALERWVAMEKDAVTEHLKRELCEDADVSGPLLRLSARYELAVVSSSALSRLDACFEATGLADVLSPERRFSAEDSLERPTSKPDPAIYTFAIQQLGLAAGEALAIEDSVTGATSAVAAGIPTIGNVRFVAAGEREARVADLEAAGVVAVIAGWAELEQRLSLVPSSS